MPPATERLFWPRRLRWRLRGAWTWPLYAALTALDAVVLHELPPVGTDIAIPVGFIIASFGNLFLIGAVAPWIARKLLERESRDPRAAPPGVKPPEVQLDRSATVLLVLATLGLVVAGLGNRPVVVSETRATEENARLVRDYVQTRASGEIQRNLETANTVRLGDDYFRTCIAYDDRKRAFCMFVDTAKHELTKDPSTVPNSEFVKR
jgi:hypothetical protein